MSHPAPSKTQQHKPARRSYPRPAAAEEIEPLYLRVPQILRRFAFSRSYFYSLVKQKKLPQPFRPMGARMSLWHAAELHDAVERLRLPSEH